MSRSILFKTNISFRFSMEACRSTACVCGHMPSATSISMTAPSHKRTAVDTSVEKSTWPGLSIKFMIQFSLSLGFFFLNNQLNFYFQLSGDWLKIVGIF